MRGGEGGGGGGGGGEGGGKKNVGIGRRGDSCKNDDTWRNGDSIVMYIFDYDSLDYEIYELTMYCVGLCQWRASSYPWNRMQRIFKLEG